MKNSVETIWQEYLISIGESVDTTKLEYTSWHFCNDEQSADNLAKLVMKNIKRGTASLYELYKIDKEPIPKENQCSVITDFRGDAKCIIKSKRVLVLPFKEVNEELAYIEGEGDKSLDYWRRVHIEFFTEELKEYNIEFNEDMLVVFEEFELVYKKDYTRNKVKLKNGKTLIIKEARPEYADKIIPYLNAVGGESDNLLFGKNEFRLNVQQEKEHISNINKDNNSIMLVGIIDEEIVSVAIVSTQKRKRIEHNGDLSMSVKKEYWNMGIASEVMRELIDFAKNNEIIKIVSLGVKADNVNAIRLYKNFGFEKVGVHKNFFNIDGNFYDEILMDLYL